MATLLWVHAHVGYADDTCLDWRLFQQKSACMKWAAARRTTAGIVRRGSADSKVCGTSARGVDVVAPMRAEYSSLDVPHRARMGGRVRTRPAHAPAKLRGCAARVVPPLGRAGSLRFLRNLGVHPVTKPVAQRMFHPAILAAVKRQDPQAAAGPQAVGCHAEKLLKTLQLFIHQDSQRLKCAGRGVQFRLALPRGQHATSAASGPASVAPRPPTPVSG